ncbi:hypothetical protein BC567DRAFT_220002 [Phyllosticta citribraziliensis]
MDSRCCASVQLVESSGGYGNHNTRGCVRHRQQPNKHHSNIHIILQQSSKPTRTTSYQFCRHPNPGDHCLAAG